MSCSRLSSWLNAFVLTLVAPMNPLFPLSKRLRDSALATSEQRPLRFYVQTGQIEWLLAPNRRFAAMLADKAYPHCYQEQPSGHNWATWEQGLAPGLMYLFDRAEENISLM